MTFIKAQHFDRITINAYVKPDSDMAEATKEAVQISVSLGVDVTMMANGKPVFTASHDDILKGVKKA